MNSGRDSKRNVLDMFEMKIIPSEYKVLIVDDVLSNILLINTLLGQEGCGIITAMNGSEALSLVSLEIPDLILRKKIRRNC